MIISKKRYNKMIDSNYNLLELLSAYKSHIGTHTRILKAIQTELKLTRQCYKVKDYVEMKDIVEEVISFIEDILKEEEK